MEAGIEDRIRARFGSAPGPDRLPGAGAETAAMRVPNLGIMFLYRIIDTIDLTYLRSWSELPV